MTRAREHLRAAFAAPETHRWAYVQRSFTGLAVAVATGDEELLTLSFDEDVRASHSSRRMRTRSAIRPPRITHTSVAPSVKKMPTAF